MFVRVSVCVCACVYVQWKESKCETERDLIYVSNTSTYDVKVHDSLDIFECVKKSKNFKTLRFKI